MSWLECARSRGLPVGGAPGDWGGPSSSIWPGGQPGAGLRGPGTLLPRCGQAIRSSNGDGGSREAGGSPPRARTGTGRKARVGKWRSLPSKTCQGASQTADSRCWVVLWPWACPCLEVWGASMLARTAPDGIHFRIWVGGQGDRQRWQAQEIAVESAARPADPAGYSGCRPPGRPSSRLA